MTEHELKIVVPAMTRVEGEGALRLRIERGELIDVGLDIFEPPRYFEKLLEGRGHDEVIDTVARICGICPVAYQMSAAQALEAAFGLNPKQWVRDMRRVFYCGEWLQSHALHIHLLAAPDFYGHDSVVGLSREEPGLVRRGLRLQALGNSLIALFGARSVHPIGARVGGFHRAPEPNEVAAILDQLQAGIRDATDLVRWAGALAIPGDEHDFTCVSLRHASDYPMAEGRIVSDGGLDIDSSEFASHFEEEHRPHSTALFASLHGEPYLVGPLARLNLNLDRLPADSARLLRESGLEFPSHNMFHSLFARALEIHVAISEAIRVLRNYQHPAVAYAEAEVSAGIGFGATEAPRGLLWHRYELDERGIVRGARIVPPTSQNQARMELDLRTSLGAFGLDRSADELRLRAEMVVRNYDPCISCATHFLRLDLDRG